MKFAHLFLGAAALSLAVMPFTAASAQGTTEKPGSAYVQCDGQPDNVTDGETAARLLGAVTLLGLFAPPHESADSSKRKFGLEGVAACGKLLSGDGQESNPRRRLGLIFGRAIHQIEAKNYQKAVDDVAMARREAEAAGLMADAYFAHSRGRAFNLIESAALVRMGRAEDARAVSLKNAGAEEYSIASLLSAPTYSDFLDKQSGEEERVTAWRTRLIPQMAGSRADRFDLVGRFGDSARLRDALIEFDAEQTPESNSSLLMARAAVAYALAGNVALGAERAKAARANADKRRLDGDPEADASELVELLDLYNIVETYRSGDLKTARRLFSARSQWLGPSLGSVLEVNRQLRRDAAADELIGGLAKSPEDLWKDHVDSTRAELLAKDKDNKTLFALAPGERSFKLYQAVAKNVWRTDKSKIIIPTKPEKTKSQLELMYLPLTDPVVAMDAYVLHAALIARSRGQQGFVFAPVISRNIIAASFRSGNRGAKGFPAELFVDANDVITKLSPLIPQPVR